MGKEGFKGLRVWQKGKGLAIYIYQVTSSGNFVKDYGLRDQIRRAAVSIPSNIAEGDELKTDKQAVRHFYMAKGSSAEVLTQAIIASEIGYIDKTTFEEIENRCVEISRMLSKLISVRSIIG
ncbi:MAG: four helix bundle protein [Proteobacteria bacterium]|nr:four helix bundle protein [Pseudomonadota bacterium]